MAAASQSPIPEPRILAETDRWWVVDKPAGWLTIPGRKSDSRTEPALSLDRWLERSRNQKVWVVHRLDRETSGVILFAKTAESHRTANEWFSSGKVRKTYECLALGDPPAPIFKVKRPVEGKPSLTQFEVRKRFSFAGSSSCFLARALPQTGRRHQIRIHLAEEGHPILGDATYRGPATVGAPSRPLSIGRVALHARKLELPGGESFEAELPEDFTSWLSALEEMSQKAGVSSS